MPDGALENSILKQVYWEMRTDRINKIDKMKPKRSRCRALNLVYLVNPVLYSVMRIC